MQKEFRISAELRKRLARPIGNLITTEQVEKGAFTDSVRKASLVITVGDRVTETAAEAGRVPDVQIVDGLEKRKKRDPPDVPSVVQIKVRNPPGSISMEAVEGVKRAFAGAKPARVLVDGEEDLLAIPAVTFAPVGATIFYGQPNEGVVVVKVDASAKARNRALMDEMGMPKTF